VGVRTYHNNATDTGTTLARSFCSMCGLTLFTTNKSNLAFSTVVIVATGTLNGDQDFKPEQEFYCKRKFGFVVKIKGHVRNCSCDPLTITF
jgi:hypothetical protein